MTPIPANLSTANPREIALAVLQHFRDRDADASNLLHDLLRRGNVHGADARLATELVMGILRQRSRLDGILAPFTRRPWKDTPPVVRDILRLGAYQLLFMDRIPPHAAVNESVALARRWAGKALAGLANAVLRKVGQVRVGQVGNLPLLPGGDTGRLKFIKSGRLPTRPTPTRPTRDWPQWYSHPAWLVKYLLAHYPAERVEALLQWNNQTPALMLRANLRRITTAELAARLTASGLRVVRAGWPAPESLALEGPVGDVAAAEWYLQGLATVQDGAAQLVARLLAPRPGERIVDWCAAPGGKTTHLAELSDDRADILALDADADRLSHIAVHAERLGLHSIRTACSGREKSDGSVGSDRSCFGRDSADAVLVDAPCSGLGTLQRHPDIRWRRQMKDIERAAKLQLEILSTAARCVRPGGRLIYSTCTLGPIENEQVIEKFLAAHPRFARANAAALADPALRPFLDGQGDLHTWPPEHCLDGFYAVSLVRSV